MTDRLRQEIAQINRDLHHIHTVRSTLNEREDRLLRRRMELEAQRFDLEEPCSDESSTG